LALMGAAGAVSREAACACGDLRVTLAGEPILVSSCCCTRCQRRTGAFFGVTVYFQPAQMTARCGAETTFRRPGAASTFHFCPRCGSSLWWAPDDASEDWIGVAGGCFADPALPSPARMVFTASKHPYVCPPEGVLTYPDAPPE
jgi:hypothetical protein